MSLDVVAALVDHFAVELDASARVLGGPARFWREKYDRMLISSASTETVHPDNPPI
jgi:hypothetical protein